MAKAGILKAAIPAAFILALVPMDASAKDTQFWNLTANTITSVQLSPTGKNEWGKNQADNDKDGTVETVTLTRSSGNQAYDDSALAAAKKLNHLLQPLPDGCPPDIYIDFTLNH